MSLNLKVCTLDGYLVEVGLILPAWVMVVLAFERFYCIMLPLRKNNFATPKYSFTLLLIYFKLKLKHFNFNLDMQKKFYWDY